MECQCWRHLHWPRGGASVPQSRCVCCRTEQRPCPCVCGSEDASQGPVERTQQLLTWFLAQALPAGQYQCPASHIQQDCETQKTLTDDRLHHAEAQAHRLQLSTAQYAVVPVHAHDRQRGAYVSPQRQGEKEPGAVRLEPESAAHGLVQWRFLPVAVQRPQLAPHTAFAHALPDSKDTLSHQCLPGRAFAVSQLSINQAHHQYMSCLPNYARLILELCMDLIVYACTFLWTKLLSQARG